MKHLRSYNTHSQFAWMHNSSLINIEKSLSRPVTKFYNSNNINAIAAELRRTKTRPTSFYKKLYLLQETMATYVNKVLITKH